MYYTIMLCSAKIAWFVALGATQVAATALPAFNVNPDSVSVSGLSSGGFMAAQLGVAYSETFNVGFGVFAGGPYDCARSQYVCSLASYRMTTADIFLLKITSILRVCTMDTLLSPFPPPI